MNFREALEKAKDELCLAVYLCECGANKGIRTINGNKVDWLSKVVYLAERELERSNENAE